MSIDRPTAASRREFIGQALTIGAAALVAQKVAAEPVKKTPTAAKPTAPASSTTSSPSLELPPLPYPQHALEPHISATTVSFHYGKHHKAYFDKTNALVKDTPLSGKPLEAIVKGSAKSKSLQKLFNNSAQAWNHNFYWQSLRPNGGGAPSGEFGKRIDKDFGSYDAFKAKFIETGADHFSNGWVWLVLDKGKLAIVDTHDADTPLVHGQKPLLVADIWEHAYYLDVKNARKEYLTGVAEHLLNWDFAAQNLG